MHDEETVNRHKAVARLRCGTWITIIAAVAIAAAVLGNIWKVDGDNPKIRIQQIIAFLERDTSPYYMDRAEEELNKLTEKDGPVLMRFLRTGDDATREAVFRILRRYRYLRDQVYDLVDCVESNDRRLVALGLRLLIVIERHNQRIFGDAKGLNDLFLEPIVKELLGSEDNERVTAALTALRDETKPLAGAQVRTLLGHEDAEIRSEAIWTLAEVFADEDSIDAIRTMLGSAEASDRAVAAEALGVLRDEGSVDKLTGLLEDADPSVRNSAWNALRLITGSAPPVPEPSEPGE